MVLTRTLPHAAVFYKTLALATSFEALVGLAGKGNIQQNGGDESEDEGLRGHDEGSMNNALEDQN